MRKKKKTHIGIVGAGPRGIAIALQARQRDYTISLFDPHPFSSWEEGALVPDLSMRSPLSFDCTTGEASLSRLSLSSFLLGGDTPSVGTQEELEACDRHPSRQEFRSYGEFLLNDLLPDITLMRERVTRLEADAVFTPSGRVDCDVVVYAAGCPPSIQIPPWVDRSRVISLRSLLLSPPPGSVAVLGGGQAGAEVYDYLLRCGVTAGWFARRAPRSDRYPAPSFQHWGVESALGGYYRLLPPERRMEYLMKVKRWQPSVTPRILSRIGKPLPVDPHIVNSFDNIVLCMGLESDMSRSLLKNCRPHPLNMKSPHLEKGFMASNGCHVSGIFAVLYDGPRQGSIISAALTAREILDIYIT